MKRSAGTTTLVLLLASFGTMSCSPYRSSVQRPVSLPEEFSATGTTLLPDKWWLSFGDPTLSDLVEWALTDNLSLRTAWDRLAQAAATARRQGAPLEPSLDLQGHGSRTVERFDSDFTTYRTDLSLGIVASYELDLWGRIQSTYDAALLDVQASREQLRAAAITLSAEVAVTWYQLVEQYGQVELLRQQLETNEKVLDLISQQFRSGMVDGAADVLQQRQLVESVRGDIAAAESQQALLEHQIAILLGQPPLERVAPYATELIVLPPLPETGLPAELIQRRPDVRGAYDFLRAADLRTAAAVADRYPRVSLAAEVDTSGEALRDLFDNWLATLAANLTAPLFDADQRQAEVDRTRAVAMERLNNYGDTVLTALSEVEDALVQERKQRELLESLEKQIELSSQAMESIRDRFLKRDVDYLRVLDALSRNQALQRTQLTQKRRLIEIRIGLCRALAGGWLMDRPTEPAGVFQL
jgi:NodT family efflux transporter outer membrane factor (OMF) lipoprotein